MNFDHVGLVVHNIARGRDFLSASFDISEWTAVFDDPVNGVLIQFGRDRSGVCYELLEPRDDSSPLAGVLTSRRAILNHVAYRVEDLAAGAAKLRAQRCAPVASAKPAIAYGGRRVQFFATPLFFVVELIEALDHQHRFDWTPAG